MPKIPKIGCFGIILVVIAVLVLGIVFLGVPAPAVHLAPGNLLTADTPAHYWDGEVELEIHPHADDIESGEEIHFYVEPEDTDELPGYYRWVFYLDGEPIAAPVFGYEDISHTDESESTNGDTHGTVTDSHGEEGKDTHANEGNAEQHHGYYGVPFTFTEEGNYGVEFFLYESEEAREAGESYAATTTRIPEKSAFPIPNTLISSWLTVLVLLCLFGFGLHKMKMVPGRFQALCESIIEYLLNFVEGAAGRENGRKFFAIFATIFLFVITNAWLALVPIFNCMGWGHTVQYDTLMMGAKEGFVVTTTLFRSANTDANLPLAIALISFVAVEYWGFSALGFRSYMGKFIKIGVLFHGFKKGPMGILIALIDFIVGLIELVLEFVRIVSFTFRLFGNMTAGEVLLFVMFFMVPMWIPLVFYGLEFLVGFIQAIVFAGLTLGFAMIAVAPHEHEEDH